MDFDLDKIEESFETLTEKVESLQEQKDELDQRRQGIEDALEVLEGDAALITSLKANEGRLESEEEQLKAETADAKSSLKAIREQLEQMEQETDNSAETMNTLRQIGENTEEGDTIIADRRAWLEECYRRVEELAAKLGEDYEKIGKFAPVSERTEQKMEKESPESEEKNSREDFAQRKESAKVSSEPTNPKQAYNNYMLARHWGKEDFRIYSQDPEWRRLVHAAYPNYELPYMDPMMEYQRYMSQHNWGKEDFPTYSQDPEWRRIVHAAYPDYELPPLKNSSSDSLKRSPNVDLSHGRPRAWSTTQEKFVSGMHGGLMYNSPVETGKKLYTTQGAAYKNIQGTCGLCCCANVLRLAGVNVGEKEMIDYAVREGLCRFQPQSYDGNGATTPKDRKAVLDHFGIQSSIEPVKLNNSGQADDETMERIGRYISDGRGVVVSVDAGIFYSDPRYLGGGHAVTLTSVERNDWGEVIGYYVCDSNRGTSFYQKDKMQRALRSSGINVTSFVIR